MRWTRFGVGSFAFLAAVTLWAAGWPATARADECRAACADGKQSCAQTARTSYRSCKAVCETAPSRGECRMVCRQEFFEAHRLCRGEHADCRGECINDPLPPSCRHCERELRACLADVLASGRSCAPACMPDQARTRSSIVRTGGCLHQCAQAMTGSAEACRELHAVCREMCGAGSPNRAFLAPTRALLD